MPQQTSFFAAVKCHRDDKAAIEVSQVCPHSVFMGDATFTTWISSFVDGEKPHMCATTAACAACKIIVTVTGTAKQGAINLGQGFLQAGIENIS